MLRTSITVLSFTISSAVMSVGTHAIDIQTINQAMTKMCDKTVQCMTQSMDAEGIPDSMRSMFVDQFSQQCHQVIQVDLMPTNETLNKKALDCIDAMSNTSCEDLLDDKDIPACKDYNDYAETIGS